MAAMSLAECTNWDLFRLFFVVARLGSMNRAAHQLGISQPTLSRRLTELERDVGAPLLFRTPAGVALTQEGEALRQSTVNMIGAFEAFQKEVRQQIGTRSSIVRISASEGMTKHWLLPRLKPLREIGDGVQFEIYSTAHQHSLASGDLDFVIRIGRTGDDELVGKRVGQIAFGIYASRDYLKSRSAPQSLSDLANHCLIGQTPEIPSPRREAEVGPGLISRFLAAEALGHGVKVSQVAGQFAATSLGLGLALLAIPFAEAEGLLRVLPSEVAALDVWLLRRKESDLRKQTRQVRQFLERELRASKYWLNGRLDQDAAPR
ncbi:DNA-binding transcriptional LysR family regulator [Bradyrhizobium sp. USDA 4341]